MIGVTPEFKKAIYIKDDKRQTTAKIIFEVVDIDASGDATILTSSESEISKKSQVSNTVLEMSNKYGTFEPDYFKLDGTFSLPPKQVETGFEVGFWSSEFSTDDGTFINPQIITSEFLQNHTSAGLTIFFDTLSKEYARDFDIDVYDSLNNIINSASVLDNENAKYIWQQSLVDYRKIVLTIYKWSGGYRRARVSEIVFGIVYEYTDEEIITVYVLEELDTLGNLATSNELKFSLDNSSKIFNILNPTGIYSALQRRQKITPFLGVVKSNGLIEYVQMGVYYLQDWQSDEGTLTATFTARDVIDILNFSGMYRKGIYQTISLYDLAVDVLTYAGITNYEIDNDLTSIIVTSSIPVIPYVQALKYIASAGSATLYSDRYGKLVIKRLDDLAIDETITLDNATQEPLIKLKPVKNAVNVNVNTFTAQLSPTEIYKGTIYINGTIDVWVDYKSFPCQSVGSVVTGGTLNSAIYYGNAALLNITATGNVNITLNGTILDKSVSVFGLKDNTIPVTEQTQPIELDNPLISSSQLASDVANWILDEYKKRYLYDVNWRMNPALEVGDIVVFEDGFNQNNPVRITSQEFDYRGSLGGKTLGNGG